MARRVRPMGRERELKDVLKRKHTLNGGILFGLEGRVIEIEATAVEVLRNPEPIASVTKISGMAHGAIQEAKDRILGAFSRLSIPKSDVRILINLAPAGVHKEGTWLDLPLAIIMLQAAGILPDFPDHLEGDYILMGEVGLHGELRRVPGALAIAFTAKPGQSLIIPSGNEKECALILAKPGHEGCGVYPVSLLEEVIEFFRGQRKLENALRERITFDEVIPKCVDFGKIRGQDRAKRAALIAAAGGHHLLLIGPPGEGKSLLASALPGILPPLTNEEKVVLTRIFSACGELKRDGVAVTRRPFRTIHHTASKQSVVGGGSNVPKPGEITLAHLGVLFLDEIAEFSRGTLESLRQPIETGEIHVTRVGASFRYPSRFTLVAAMNPCPCGYSGSDRCRCTDSQVKKYLKKLSGPLLDRIDLQVEMERLSTEERFAPTEKNTSPKCRKKVDKARRKQHERFAGTDVPYNGAIPGGDVKTYCRFSTQGNDRYRFIVESERISTRSMDRLAKVSRTIADLEDSEEILPVHVDEAKGFVVGGCLRDAW